jgi:NAD(P)-dependent dehydrogenase (short-subunit alcohol dehydrogenase family)
MEVVTMKKTNRPSITTIAAGLLAGAATWYFLKERFGKRPYSFAGRAVLITGGSRGLGLVLARHFIHQGARVAILARDASELERASHDLKAHGGDVLTLSCDLRNRDEIHRAIDRAIQSFGAIDVLVNNAGIIQVGPLDHMTMEDFDKAMAVHFYAPLIASLHVIPQMRERGGGRIVNISSIGGKVVIPHMLPYVSSKYALVGFSDALRAEVRRDNILVTTIIPGLMRTGSPSQGEFKGQHKLEYAWFATGASLPLISMDADRAAQKILEACRRGRASLVLTVKARAAIALSALFPELSAGATNLISQLLPSPLADGSTAAHRGWESRSALTPSWLTRLSDAAAKRNNERPPGSWQRDGSSA